MSIFLKQVEDTYELTSSGYGLLVVLLILALIAACFFTGKDSKNHFSAKQLVFASMCVTLATVTSMIKFFNLPMGGSVTLFSMFFITFVGYLYGVRAGLTSALAFGILQLILGPYIVSIPQLLCDYILAFGALGFSGFFNNKKHGMVIGYVAGILGRLAFSVLSGVIFFGQYAPEGMHPFVYSLAYNGIYIGAEGIMTLVLVSIPAVHKALNMIKVMANENEVRDNLSLV
ncbi:energy-coupled thiamine transporter ThiT [Butyrivibrio sp. WCD3002]|uniref:energy-coupled thiamine transporter ThiT n=1 Tax=Butyrivibrio sp. WCD3002 TaxID=1280676 RepID=UPI00040B125C|nr:energy-coupled thiamine transporter ThiT [Butyrivibrio sp. WCD3002]